MYQLSRCLSTSLERIISINELRALISQKPNGTLELFDVREPHEYADGFIPTAINLPAGDVSQALKLSNNEFKTKYGVNKPSKDNENVVFYCRAGVRSASALSAAQSQGYANARNFKGSWLEWIGSAKA